MKCKKKWYCGLVIPARKAGNLLCYFRWNYRSLAKFAAANKKDLNHWVLGNFLVIVDTKIIVLNVINQAGPFDSCPIKYDEEPYPI